MQPQGAGQDAGQDLGHDLGPDAAVPLNDPVLDAFPAASFQAAEQRDLPEVPEPVRPLKKPRRSLSLRVRLLAGLVALVIVGVVAADLLALSTLRSTLVSKVDLQLVNAADAPRPGGNPQRGATLNGGPSNFYVEYFDATGASLLVVSTPVNSTSTPQLPVITQTEATASATTLTPRTVSSVSGDGRWRYVTVPGAVRTTDGDVVYATEVIASPLRDIDATYRHVQLVDASVLGAVVVALLVLGVVVVRIGLRPLEEMATTADEIAAGDLTRRVSTTDRATEVGRLGHALNGMLEQIEVAFAARQETEDRLRRFVGDASHELRTPLTSIRGFAELIRSGMASDPESQKRALTRIEAEATRMGGLVEDLLLLARLDEQRPLDHTPVDLGALVRDAAEDARAIDPTRTVTVTIQPPPGAPDVVVLGDDPRLRQVLSNLVGNALRHTPAGTSLHLGVGVLAGEAVLAVADTGPGMAADDANRIFERFYRVDPSRTRGTTGGGSGLGLAIVAAVVEAHGGRVGLVTAPGQGATFTVSIPWAAPAQETPVTPAEFAAM